MSVVVTVTSNRFPEIARKLPVEAGKIVQKTLFAGQTWVRISMAEQKSGRAYGAHTASAPGETPAMDTGALANSIQTEMDSQTSGTIFTNMEYAAYLEFGTRKMAARPFMAPMAEAIRPEFLSEMAALEKRL